MNRSGSLVIYLSLLLIALIPGSSCRPRVDNTQSLIIDVQPFTGISPELITYTVKQLKQIYSNIEVRHEIPLPPSAFYPAHKRYRADSLIRFLKDRTPKGHISIGLTSSDISTTKGSVADWGVMGLGYRPGASCVVSTFRLSKNNLREQLYKVCIHELGHTEGLPHCPVKSCFMRDAEGHNTTEEEKEFCASCRRYLEMKGWHFR